MARKRSPALNLEFRFKGYIYNDNGERQPVYESYPTGRCALKEFDPIAYKEALRARAARIRENEKNGQLRIEV